MQLVTIKLPFWATLRAAHASFFANTGVVLRIFLPLFVLFCAAAAALNWYHFAFDRTAIFVSAADTLFMFAEEIIGVLLASIAAVKWHRLLLLDEPATWSRFTPAVLGKYVFVALLVWAAASLPFYGIPHAAQALFTMAVNKTLDVSGADDSTAVAVETAAEAEAEKLANESTADTSTRDTTPTETTDAESEAASMTYIDWTVMALEAVGLILFALAVWAVLGYVPMRLSLALPAIATGNFATPLSRAWAMSRGNFWRLFWGSVLSLLIPATIAVAFAVTTDDTTRSGFVLGNTVLSGAIFASTLIWVGFLSHTYRALSHDA